MEIVTMRILRISLISLTLVLSACSGTSTRPSVNDELQAMGLQRAMNATATIPRYRINGWRAIDDDNIVVTAGVNNRYLVELQPGCFDLANAFSIGFRTPMNRVDRFDRIIYRSSIAGVQSCTIRNITALERIGN